MPLRNDGLIIRCSGIENIFKERESWFVMFVEMSKYF
jgi:hypothetical protein